MNNNNIIYQHRNYIASSNRSDAQKRRRVREKNKQSQTEGQFLEINHENSHNTFLLQVNDEMNYLDDNNNNNNSPCTIQYITCTITVLELLILGL